MRAGNEQLLNNLEEGVIIIDEDQSDVLFLNKAAQNVSNRSFSTSDEAKFDIKNKIYAQLNNESFLNDIDFEKAIESLKIHTEYQSIEEIIES